MQSLRSLFVVASLSLLGACASGPKYADVKGGIPTLKADQGRVYFYRSSSMMGAAIQPSIQMNGATVGDSKPGGFFYVDAAAGSIEVSTSTELEKKLTFVLDKGQTRYVKTSVGFGLMVGRVYPELVDNATGEKDIADLSYTGQSIKK